MKEISYSTPNTNRGVVNTKNSEFSPEFREKCEKSLNNEIKMCVDWCQCTIFSYEKSIYDLYKELFNVDSSYITMELKNLYGYDKCYSYKDIKIYVSSKRDDMGIHILLSGTGCRQVEDLKIGFIDLFKKIRQYNAHYTRLDIAIDNFTNKYFSMYRVKKSIKDNCVVSRFRNTIEFIKTQIKDSSNKGYTIWFGSRASDIQIVFYDKLKERESQNQIVSDNIKYWCRLEIRFRNDYASQVVLNLMEKDFNEYIKSVLKNYIDFVELNPKEKNRSRLKTIDWWKEFLDNVYGVRLYNNNYVATLSKKQSWLENSTSKTNAMVLLSNIENLYVDKISCEYLVKYFTKGFINIENSDLQFINEYRIKNGFNPIELEDLKYMIGEIKDVLLEKR